MHHACGVNRYQSRPDIGGSSSAGDPAVSLVRDTVGEADAKQVAVTP
jgi:hypothetical protein